MKRVIPIMQSGHAAPRHASAPATGFVPAPMTGLVPAPMSGFAPTPMSGFAPTPMSGFAPAPMTGLAPAPMSGALTFHIKSFGCQMNTYDAHRMADSLVHNGLTSCADWQQADVVIVNTCSVRDKAQEKLFHLLGRLREHKESHPGFLIGVGGCVASQEAEQLLLRAPFVDVVFGPQSLHRLPQLLARSQRQGTAQLDVSFPELEKFDNLPVPSHTGTSAFVTIMEGCSKYCSFCVVPYTRGEEISRPLEQVLEEVAALCDQGAREITFLGQNVNAYQGAAGEAADLALLLTHAARISGVERLRFTTSHALHVNQRLMQAFREEPKIASHMHLPLQSGSNGVLAAMKRGYTLEQFRVLVDQLRESRPDIHLTSDFIVGFPGETDDDFEATMQAAQSLEFDDSYAFIYSPRPGTPAARLAAMVPQDVARERLSRLQKLLADHSLNWRRRKQGTVQQVLVDGPSRRDAAELSGRTSHNHTVTFPAPPRLVGQLVPVRITEAATHTLRGEWQGDA